MTKRKAQNAPNWTPLEGISPVRRGRGFSFFTAEEGARIRKFWMENQVSQTAIAAFFAVNINCINSIVNRRAKFHRPRVRELSSAEVRELHKQHQAGKSIAYIAQRNHIGTESLILRFEAEQLPFTLKRPADLDYIIELLRQGLTTKQVCEKTGLHPVTISNARARIRAKIKSQEKTL